MKPWSYGALSDGGDGESPVFTRDDLPRLRGELSVLMAEAAAWSGSYPLHEGPIARLSLIIPLLEYGVTARQSHDGFCINDRLVVAVHKKRYRMVNGDAPKTWGDYFDIRFIIARATGRPMAELSSGVVTLTRPPKPKAKRVGVLLRLDGAKRKRLKQIALDRDTTVQALVEVCVDAFLSQNGGDK